MPKKAKTSKKNTPKAVNAPSFEKALERLEDIVSQLESAEAPLEKALALYEEGVGLSRFCSQQLKNVERKVELLEDKNNELRGRPFIHESSSMAGSKGFEEEDADYEEEDDEESEENDKESDEDEEDNTGEAEEAAGESEEGGQRGFQESSTKKENETQEKLF